MINFQQEMAGFGLEADAKGFRVFQCLRYASLTDKHIRLTLCRQQFRDFDT